jgi:hypothetical protein
MINDIICAIPTRLVAVFKDYLYFDDPTEYLRRWYTHRESAWRITKIYEFLSSKNKETRVKEHQIFKPYILGSEIEEILRKNIKKKAKAWADRMNEIDRINKKKRDN